MTRPRIALILSSTRKTRFADIPAAWLKAQAEAHGDLDVEIVDLRDHPMPFFDEVASNAWVPSQDPAAREWQKTVAGFDGFIFVVAEYNRSITAVLKNALDQAAVEWRRKPMGALGYGSMGGTAAVQHLRQIAVELQMVPVRHSVMIGGADFRKVHPGFGGSGRMEDIEAHILPPTKALLDDIAWWSRLTMSGRIEEARTAA